MNILLKEQLARAIGQNNLKPYGVDFDQWRWHDANKGQAVDLAKYSAMKVIELKTMVEEHIKIRGAKLVLRDINHWLDAVKESPTAAKTANVKVFSEMIVRAMKNVEGHRLYLHDDERGQAYAYYLESVKYTPPQKVRGGRQIPHYTRVFLYYYEFGSLNKRVITFHDEDVKGRTVFESLAYKGYYPESPELRADYLATHALYINATDNIGKQYLARGKATDDLDGNPKDDSSGRWWISRTSEVLLDRNDEPTRVVIDVYKESDTEGSSGYHYTFDRDDADNFDLKFWGRAKARKTDEYGDVEDDDDELDAAAEEDETEPTWPEIPTHPTLAVFDLRRHLRLRLDVTQLEEYVYDHALGDKLILPADNRALVDILLAHKEGAFKDIIAGKGAGAVILCAGPPGTGKTLTAEAYAEVSERPLYTIQCSQLGTTADELESELLKVFARGERWNAITLLDEADVYVRQRGDDLEQNAIVGVFLRTLEYYKGTLFMTTNRVDLVDDAVLSRCIARVQYDVPNTPDQIKIWKVLAEGTGASITEKVIRSVAAEYPRLSGRDVKNLLKLALLVSQGKPITLDTVKFVKKFKPTFDAPEAG